MTTEVLPSSIVSEELSTAALTLDGRVHSAQEFLKYLQREGRLKELLSQWSVEQIIHQEAETRQIGVPGEELQRAADIFRRSRKLLSAAETNDWLSRNGITILDFEDKLEFRLKTQLLFHAITENAEQQFSHAPSLWDRIQIRMIHVEHEGLAEEIRLQLIELTADFASLAQKHSVHSSAANGGLLNEMFRRDLIQLIPSHADSAETGDQIGPLSTSQGWMLVDVVAIKRASFDAETEAAIRKHLFQQWLSARMRESKISYPLLDLLSCQNDS